MENFSSIQKIPVSGHAELEFADIRVGRDNRLFVDPSRIHLAALSGDPWAVKADTLIESYFHTLCHAAEGKDVAMIHSLITGTCGEINATHLGLSSGRPAGNGASFDLIFPVICQMIDSGMFDHKLVNEIADVPIWAEGISSDRLSNWVTNIIWPVLEEFTRAQYLKYALVTPACPMQSQYAWNPDSCSWVKNTRTVFSCGTHDVLLCPKSFLHERLLYSTEDFLRKIVLKFRQREHLDQNSPFCRTSRKRDGSTVVKGPTKKTLMQIEVKGHRHHDYVYQHSQAHPDYITRYHSLYETRPGNTNRFISDNRLDELLYD